jgi:hypothetical protein
MNGTEPDSTSATQTNSITCDRCDVSRSEVTIREQRSKLVIDIPLGWTAMIVPHEGDPGLLIEYTCQRCNIELYGKE